MKKTVHQNGLKALGHQTSDESPERCFAASQAGYVCFDISEQFSLLGLLGY